MYKWTGRGGSQEAFLEGCAKTHRGFRWETCPYISLCDKNDEESDKEGVFQIELRTFSREESPKDFSGGAYQDDYGIFIYTLQNYPKK